MVLDNVPIERRRRQCVCEQPTATAACKANSSWDPCCPQHGGHVRIERIEIDGSVVSDRADLSKRPPPAAPMVKRASHPGRSLSPLLPVIHGVNPPNAGLFSEDHTRARSADDA